MPKINVYLPDELATAVRDARLPVSAICQAALERAVRDVTAVRGTEGLPGDDPAHGPFTRFTPRARTAIGCAQTAAREYRHAHVDTEHLLLGLLDEGSNLAVKVLAALEVEPNDVRSELLGSCAPPGPAPVTTVPFASRAKEVLEATTKEALGLSHNYVGCEHLLLGLLAVEDGLASQVLRRLGVELRSTRRAVVTALSGFVHAREQEAAPVPSADSFPPGGATLDDILQRLEAIERRLS